MVKKFFDFSWSWLLLLAYIMFFCCQPVVTKSFLSLAVISHRFSSTFLFLLFTGSTLEESTLNSWCHVAYWELSQRIGQLFPVTPSSIDIFQDVAQGCGISLDTLHKASAAKSASVASLRSKIGAGVTLSNEGHLVWLYNRSERDVFVTSYCLNIDKSCEETWRVCKVPPGHTIVIYDYDLLQARLSVDLLRESATDLHSIHLSFVKGWSGSYSRQQVLSCECWLEILINKTWFEGR